MTYQCCGLDCLSWSGNIDTCDPDIYTTRGQHGRTASTFQWSIVSGCRVLIPNLNVYILCLWEWMQFSSLHILTLFVGRYEDHMCYSVRIVNSGYSCFLQFIFQVTFHVVCYFVISSFPFYLSFVASPIKNWCCFTVYKTFSPIWYSSVYTEYSRKWEGFDTTTCNKRLCTLLYK